jgi:methionyl aminopeptidase
MFTIGSFETRVKADGWTVATADGSLAAHWEHSIAVTADGPRILTLAAGEVIEGLPAMAGASA